MATRIHGTNTAAAPGITGDDTDSGLYYGTDQVSVSTAGTERFRVASAGQLGIGGATYGTDGHVLTSTGGSSAPAWEAVAPEGEAIKSTTNSNEAATKFLRADGDGTCSWQTPSSGVSSDAQNNTKGGDGAGAVLDGDTLGNTLFGENAGTAIDSGDYNNCFGFEAGKELTSGTCNVAIGKSALESSTNASCNTAIGIQALEDNTASNNTAIGAYASMDAVSGVNNVAIGYEANKVNASGSYNVVIGHSAMKTTTASGSCVAIGYEANMTEDGGNSTTAVGSGALRSSTQHGNTAVGAGAMYAAQTAWDCTALGKDALSGCLDSQENTAVGNNAIVADCGGKNTAVGHQAGTAITGAENTCIGVRAGLTISSGSANTCVGEYAGKYIQTGSDNIYIGRDSHAAAEGDSGSVVVGINLSSKGANKAFIGGSSGAYNEQNYSAFSTTSDRRIKKNITNNTIGLDKINQITVRNFEYKKFKKDDEGVYLEDSDGKYIPETTDDEITWSEFDGGNTNSDSIIVKNTGTQVGAIAQELESVLPGLVETDAKHGLKSVNTDNLVWYLVNAVKELSTEVNTLKTKVAALEAA